MRSNREVAETQDTITRFLSCAY